MELPIRIISTKRWRAMNERIERAEHLVNTIERTLSGIRNELSNAKSTTERLRIELNRLRRKFNEKSKESWQYTGR